MKKSGLILVIVLLICFTGCSKNETLVKGKNTSAPQKTSSIKRENGFNKVQSEYKSYAKLLDINDNVAKFIKQDIDLDGNNEILIAFGEIESQIRTFVLRENKGMLQVIGEASGSGYTTDNVQLVTMRGNSQKFIETHLTNGANLSGFALYEVVKDKVNQIAYSASATGSGDDELTSTKNDGIYDGYAQFRGSYDVLYYTVSRYYMWNGKSFDFISSSVDVKNYPESVEDVVRQFLQLNMLWDDDRNSLDVLKRLSELNISNKSIDTDKIDKYYGLGDSGTDWRFEITNPELQLKTSINQNTATATVPIKDKELIFTLEKDNEKWKIVGISGDFESNKPLINEEDEYCIIKLGTLRRDIKSRLAELNIPVIKEYEGLNDNNEPDGLWVIYTNDFELDFNKNDELTQVFVNNTIPTLRGLKNGDTLEKMYNLYGREASYDKGWGMYLYKKDRCSFGVICNLGNSNNRVDAWTIFIDK